jgi:hypothetical protein
MNACLSFLDSIKILGSNEEFFSKKPWADMLWLIVAWIMNVLVLFNIDDYTMCRHWCVVEAVILLILIAWWSHPSRSKEHTYGHAQEMRASMTYAFDRLNGLGNMPWHKLDAGGSIMVGNPSISVEVSSFMCPLCRCKVIFYLCMLLLYHWSLHCMLH